MSLRVDSHWLEGPGIDRAETDNHYGVIRPEFLVMHYTAGRSAASSIAHFQDRASGASAHVVIGRDGSITQLMPLNLGAWHAGESAWAGRQGLNRYSIGIELDNAGELKPAGADFKAWFGMLIPADQVVHARHKNRASISHWHAYTDVQLAAAQAVASAVVAAYGLREVIGHDDIAPARKVDPGPAFPMETFRAALFAAPADAPVVYEVSSGFLNVRAGPAVEHPTVADPLRRGTRLEILEFGPQWSRIRASGTAVEGWIRNIHIARTGALIPA